MSTDILSNYFFCGIIKFGGCFQYDHGTPCVWIFAGVHKQRKCEFVFVLFVRMRCVDRHVGLSRWSGDQSTSSTDRLRQNTDAQPDTRHHYHRGDRTMFRSYKMAPKMTLFMRFNFI